MTERRRLRGRVTAARAAYERWAGRALQLVEHTPVLSRSLAELARVEVVTRAMTLAAQVLISVVPLLIVLGAFLPEPLAVSLVARVQDTVGITGSSAASLRQVLTAPGTQVRTQAGVVGLVLALASALSFARALQATYERVWDLPRAKGIRGKARGAIWLVGWLVYVLLLATTARALGLGSHWSPGRLVVQSVLGLVLWWWTARILLLGRVPSSALAPGAVLTGVGSAVLTEVSRFVMPRYVDSNVSQYGALGVVFALTSWLVVYAGLVVVAAVVGRAVAEDPAIGPQVSRVLGLVRPSRPPRPVVRNVPAADTPEEQQERSGLPGEGEPPASRPGRAS